MLQALIGPVTGLLDKFIEDKDQKAKLAHDLATMAERHAQELAKGQLEINAAEAKHRSIFVAGWRPFIGWTCGVALAYVAIFEPIMRFIALRSNYSGPFPVIDTTLTMQVLLGMLGLAGIRGYEKSKGVAR